MAVGLFTIQALPHRVPGLCCTGVNCGHDEVNVGFDGIVWTIRRRQLCWDREGARGATRYAEEVVEWEAGRGA